MKKLLPLLLSLFVAACGNGGQDEPGNQAPAPVLKRTFTQDDIERMRTRDWEWYVESQETLPEAVGRILTPDGEPVPGASATVVVQPPIKSILPRRLDTVQADENGVFRLTDIPTNVWVFATAPGWAGRLVDAPDLFFVGDQEPTIELRPATVISGRVSDPEGAPLPGATVLASTAVSDWFDSVVTDGEGRYRIEDAPREMVEVAVLPGKYVGQRREVDLSNGEVADADLGAVVLPAVVGSIVDENTGLPVKGAIVSGVLDREFLIQADDQGQFRVEGAIQPMLFARAWGYAQVPIRLIQERESEQSIRVPMTRGGVVQGRVTDVDGTPLAGVRVKAIVGAETGRGQLVYGPLTAEDGTYDFAWVPVAQEGSSVTLVGSKPGWLSGYLERFTVKKGDFVTGKDIEMVPPSTLRARIVDYEGKPLAFARFRSFWTGEVPEEIRQFLTNVTTGKSRADGTFELHGVRAGTSRLWVRAEGYASWETTFTVEEGQDLADQEFIRPKGLPIAGRLVWVGEKPPEGALVVLKPSSGQGAEEIHVEPEGTFRIRGLPPGEYGLELVLPGFEPGRLSVPAGTVDVELILRALSRLTVTVHFPEDLPPAGHLELRGVKGDAMYGNPLYRDLDADHLTWKFEDLSPGGYVLSVEAGQYYAREEFLLPRGEHREFDLHLALGGTLLGTVVLPDENSPSGIAVEYLPPGGGPPRGTTTDVKGRFRFAGLPPGDVKVRVHASGYPPAVGTATVTAGETTTFDIPIQVGGRILVRVLTPEGEPAVNAIVGLQDAEGEPGRYWLAAGRSARTSGDGTLELIGIEPGRYTVAAVLDETRAEVDDVKVEEGRRIEVELTLSK